MKTRRAPRRRAASARAPLWLFDLDNTLHDASRAVFPAIDALMTQYIVDALHVTRAEADRLRTDYTRRYGAALLGLARHHPVDVREFLRVSHAFADLPSMLRAERGLARTLAALPGRKIVLTNAPQAYARAVLAQLGIAPLFDALVAIEQMRERGVHGAWRAKPQRAVLRRVLRGGGRDAPRRGASGIAGASGTSRRVRGMYDDAHDDGRDAHDAHDGHDDDRHDARRAPRARRAHRACRTHGARVSPADVILVEDTRGHLKRYRRMGIRTVWMTGHLPTVSDASVAALTMPFCSGRPHYVDRRIRSLKSLRRMRVPARPAPG